MAASDVQAFLPIAELSSYLTKWTIKARVTNRAPVRTFKKGAGEGKVFHVELLDAQGGEIRASFFNDASDKFFPVLQPGKVFSISRGNLKVANKQFNQLSHRYELVFERDAMISEITDDTGIQSVKYNFVDLRSVQAKPLPCRVDLCGIVLAFRPAASVKSKDGREFMKRDVTIVDDTATSMDVTLWGDYARMSDEKFEGKPVVALKSVLVKEFNQTRSGSVLESGSIAFQPDGTEAVRVQRWWKEGGNSQEVKALSMNSGLGLVSLQDLQSKSVPCRVDLCGVVTSFRSIMSVTAKDGRQFTKRDVTIADETATSMDVTLWGETAKLEDSKFGGTPVVLLRGVLLKEFNQSRQGSLLESGSLAFEPDSEAASRVRSWWTTGGGASQSLRALSYSAGAGAGAGARARNAQACTLGELRQLAERVGEQPELFGVVTRLALVQTRKQGEQQPLYYNACAEPRDSGLPCNRKVDTSGFCASCNRAGKVAVRLNLRCRFADCTDSMYLTTFHEAAQNVLAMKGEELVALEKSGEGGEGRELLESRIKKQYFSEPLQCIIRSKLGSYNGEARTDTSCIDVRPVSRREHGRTMLKEIQEMAAAAAA